MCVCVCVALVFLTVQMEFSPHANTLLGTSFASTEMVKWYKRKLCFTLQRPGEQGLLLQCNTTSSGRLHFRFIDYKKCFVVFMSSVVFLRSDGEKSIENIFVWVCLYGRFAYLSW